MQHVRTAKAQSTFRLTASQKEEAKRVKGQEKNSKKGEKQAETAAVVEVTGNADKIFTFTCTSNYVEVST